MDSVHFLGEKIYLHLPGEGKMNNNSPTHCNTIGLEGDWCVNLFRFLIVLLLTCTAVLDELAFSFRLKF